MVILALETATRAGSVALVTDGALHASAGDPARTHGQRLPGELLDLLQAHGHTVADVDQFAVISGPGSFTGLRVGIATIQGLALATGKPVVAVPTLNAIAHAWRSAHPDDTRVVVPCIDGQRGEVFFGAITPTGESLVEARVASPAEAVELLGRLKRSPLVVVGDGAVRYGEVFRSLDASTAPVPGTLAAAAATLAAHAPEQAGTPHALRPLYVRRPDAEIARDRHAARAAGSGNLVIDRVSSPEDIAAVEALQREAFTNPWGAEAIRWELENTDVARLYVSRDPAGRIVAYCACWVIFDELHINSLAVAVEHRRRGLAIALLRAVMREVARENVKSATLEVRRSNVAALALYEKLDFKVEAVRRDYYQDPREDALVLWNRRIA